MPEETVSPPWGSSKAPGRTTTTILVLLRSCKRQDLGDLRHIRRNKNAETQKGLSQTHCLGC